MIFTVRLLTEPDLPQIEAIIRSKKKCVRRSFTDEDKDRQIENIKTAVVQQQPVYGTFLGDELRCFMMVHRWTAVPYYSWSVLYSKTSERFSLETSGMAALFTHVITEHEKNGYFRWFFVRDYENWPAGFLIKLFKNIPSFMRYHRVVEEVVEPETLSVYPAHNKLLAMHTHPRRMMIISGTLKQLHRPSADLLPE